MTSTNTTPYLQIRLLSEGAESLFDEGQTFPLFSEQIVIGRSKKNQNGGAYLSIGITQISRVHAKIFQDNNSDRYQLVDMRSQNNTYLNGEKLAPEKPYLLVDGDIIKLGQVIAFTFCFEDDDVTEPGGSAEVVLTEGLSLNPITHSVYVSRVKLEPPLTPQQFKLLLLLYREQGETVTRYRIAEEIWPDDLYDGVDNNRIDGVVSRLRARIKAVDAYHQYIKSIHGVGYQFIQYQ